MRRLLIGVFAAGIALLAGTVVLAQGVITDIKTPPLQASDTFSLPLAIHPLGQPAWAGWAGAIVKMHILDAGEMDVLGLHPGPGLVGPTITNPFGPASENSQSEARFFTFFLPTPESGIDIEPSINLPAMTVDIHVKNSDPAGNSDIDATFMFWNIWHVRTGFTSQFIPLRESDFIFQHVGPNSTLQAIHLLEPGEFHLSASLFYATFLNTATLGIEHVPEPASALLLAVGMASAVTGLWFRRRRRKLAA